MNSNNSTRKNFHSSARYLHIEDFSETCFSFVLLTRKEKKKVILGIFMLSRRGCPPVLHLNFSLLFGNQFFLKRGIINLMKDHILER